MNREARKEQVVSEKKVRFQKGEQGLSWELWQKGSQGLDGMRKKKEFQMIFFFFFWSFCLFWGRSHGIWRCPSQGGLVGCNLLAGGAGAGLGLTPP